MDEGTESKLQLDVFKLKIITSRLHALSIANTESVMHMISALAEDPGLTPSLRAKSLEEFKAFKKQIDILSELNDLLETESER
ncbi:hypothetical protein [Pseudomonas coronafaciens]|uniref:Uncharacterized protein n=1 Tax=Pseudomonas coronafaciens pv. coronafaciens TaxID=235275 RepID=A0AAE6UNW1_9PSED|nr:hypothetical protein [Pseudomonas coronafaciens]QGT81568.1 hypothetical protein GMO17_10385 [Pseudomonas coronafaciens pv. coronafaciens]QIQ74447.1 hypothetical protein HBB04_04867 [Pseudomonas coronafaciens]RMM84504.1 hypothetical protein ALQ71_03924 [Pseudomonas coronafaciens pv. striafaciens]